MRLDARIVRGAVAQAELRRGDSEPRILRGDPQVAAQRDVHPCAQAISADHGDDHLVAALQALGHAAGDLLVILDACGARALFLVLRDVRAGDEGLVSLALQHDHADLGILLEALERLRDRLPHVDRDGVPSGGIVEREPADRSLFFGDDALAERPGCEGRLPAEGEEFFLGHEPCVRGENRDCKPCRAGATAFPGFIRALRRNPVSRAPISATRCACGRRIPRAYSRRPRSRSPRAARAPRASAARARPTAARTAPWHRPRSSTRASPGKRACRGRDRCFRPGAPPAPTAAACSRRSAWQERRRWRARALPSDPCRPPLWIRFRSYAAMKRGAVKVRGAPLYEPLHFLPFPG